MSDRKKIEMHELKTWHEPFWAIMEGTKKFEFRLNDRDFREGDILCLREWNPFFKEYTGRMTLRKVTYILTSGFGIPEGYCIMSIEPYMD